MEERRELYKCRVLTMQADMRGGKMMSYLLETSRTHHTHQTKLHSIKLPTVLSVNSNCDDCRRCSVSSKFRCMHTNTNTHTHTDTQRVLNHIILYMYMYCRQERMMTSSLFWH